MISFECDYNNGAHPKVLENLIKYNDSKPTPYGFDEFSERAKNCIREAIGMPRQELYSRGYRHARCTDFLSDGRHPDQRYHH